MRTSIKFLAALVFGINIFSPTYSHAATTKAEPTTRSDAVIFKIHNIDPVSEDGIVKGCNYTITLYNRTSINFRTFTINLDWNDKVDEGFKFDKYVENIIGVEEAEKQRAFFQSKDGTANKTQTSITVNAFGADKQVSLRSYMDNEKCYLMFNEANFTVTPCDIARNASVDNNLELIKNDCTALFQFVGPKNPEYFGDFKKISATEEAINNEASQASELSDIDMVIEKIVENMGTSDKALTNIY